MPTKNINRNNDRVITKGRMNGIIMSDTRKRTIDDYIDPEFSFSIPVTNQEVQAWQQQQQQQQQQQNSNNTVIVPQHLIDLFQKDGFIVIPNVISKTAVNELNDHLEDVLRGTYNRNVKPDKVPKLLKMTKPKSTTIENNNNNDNQNNNNNNDKNDKNSCSTNNPLQKQKTDSLSQNNNDSRHCNNNNINSKKQSNKNTLSKKSSSSSSGSAPLGFTGNLQNVRVLQIINIHKADSLFRQLVTHSPLGHIIAQLTKWNSIGGGVRLAQDQVWAKPPGAPPLVFHRDSPYFMFDQPHVVTVWIALDDMTDPDIGPLEYVRASHLWGHGRMGSARQFFQDSNYKSLLYSAAKREGIDPHLLEIITLVGLQAGGISIHDGKTWHGSNKNATRNRPRRGIGLHFVPGNVRFTVHAKHSKLWKRHVENVNDPSTVELSQEDFPLVWVPQETNSNDY